MIDEMPVKLLKEVENEVTRFLRELIRINTTNPPGNETAAAKYLAENLSQDDFKCELFESAPERNWREAEFAFAFSLGCGCC